MLGRLIRARVDIVAQFTLMSGSSVGGFGLLDRYDVRPSYYTYRLWQAFGDELLYAQSDGPSVSLYAARKGDALTLMFVNLGAGAVTRPLRLDHFAVSGDAQSWLFDAQHNPETQAAAGVADGSDFTVPPYAMVLLSIPGRSTH